MLLRVLVCLLLAAASAFLALLGALNVRTLLQDFHEAPNAVYAVVAALFFTLAGLLAWAGVRVLRGR
ncbi:MAG: hypothetical protein ICV74_05515 [Thermoleophilia bacterium]|nr:hypothetical protein [Thermoleophilia bacterium]